MSSRVTYVQTFKDNDTRKRLAMPWRPPGRDEKCSDDLYKAVDWIFVVLSSNRKTPDKGGKQPSDSAAVCKRDADNDEPDEVVLGKRPKLETVSAEEIK